MEKAVIIKTDGTKEIAQFEIGKSYELLSKSVGGYIQLANLPSKGIAMWCNEEGKLTDLPQTPSATALWVDDYSTTDVMVGDVIITSGDISPDGDTLGLSDEQVADLMIYDKAISLLF
jgi:hypothetical protein